MKKKVLRKYKAFITVYDNGKSRLSITFPDGMRQIVTGIDEMSLQTKDFGEVSDFMIVARVFTGIDKHKFIKERRKQYEKDTIL